MAAATIRQMRKPIPVPSQIYMDVSVRLWISCCNGTAYLLAELFVDNGIATGTTKSLFEESEEDGDNDDGLKRLAKHDEEDGDGKDVDRHVEGVLAMRVLRLSTMWC